MILVLTEPGLNRMSPCAPFIMRTAFHLIAIGSHPLCHPLRPRLFEKLSATHGVRDDPAAGPELNGLLAEESPLLGFRLRVVIGLAFLCACLPL